MNLRKLIEGAADSNAEQNAENEDDEWVGDEVGSKKKKGKIQERQLPSFSKYHIEQTVNTLKKIIDKLDEKYKLVHLVGSSCALACDINI